MPGARGFLSRYPNFGWLKMLDRTHSSRHRSAPGSGGPTRLVSLLSGIRDGFFSMDLYGYTPSLIVSEYKTLISLFTSFLVISAFLTAVAYTTYIWVMATLNQTEADQVHDEAIAMLPPNLVTGSEMLPLPQFGVLLLLGNGTFVNWAEASRAFKLTFQQSVICNSDAANKRQDPLPQQACSFDDTSNIANPKVTSCAAWDAATVSLTSLNNTAANFCNIAPDSAGLYSVPRIMGTFYNTEYSYITATISMNTSLTGSATFVNMVSKGSMQIFLSYNYTSPGNLAQGVVKPDLNQIWSRRLNLFPNMTVKAEVLIRSRVAAVHSYWWDVPSLQNDILDYSPWTVETYVSIPGSAAPGFTDIGKVFLHFDDKDTLMDLVPQNDALAIVSGWGGFLSILLAVGAPAMMINQMIFHHKVKKLISDDKITFDEGVREMRSEAVSKSYAAMGGKAVMRKPSIRSRRGSVLALLPMRLHKDSSSGQDKSQKPSPTTSGAVRSSPPKASSKQGPAAISDGSVSGSRPSMLTNHTDPGLGLAPGAVEASPPKLLSASGSAAGAGAAAGRPPRPTARLPSNQVLPTVSLGSGSGPSGQLDMDLADAAAAARHARDSSGAESFADDDVHAASDSDSTDQRVSSAAPHIPGQTAHIDNRELQQMTDMLTAPVAQQQRSPRPVSESREELGADPPETGAKNGGQSCQHVPSIHPAAGAARRSVDLTTDPSTHRRRLSLAKPLECGCGLDPATSAHFDRISQFSAEADEPVGDQQVASMAVKYDGDCFADDDEDENYEDVVRHATSECNALFHLRQVVKLVQQHSPVLTLWSDHLTQSKEPVLKRRQTKTYRGDGDAWRKDGSNTQPPLVPAVPQGWIPQQQPASDAAPSEGRATSPTRSVAALGNDVVGFPALQQTYQSQMAAQDPPSDGHPG